MTSLLIRKPQQEHLAKAKDYAEAHKMKLKSDALEAWELEQWRNKRQADLCQRESKFKHTKAQVLVHFVFTLARDPRCMCKPLISHVLAYSIRLL